MVFIECGIVSLALLGFRMARRCYQAAPVAINEGGREVDTAANITTEHSKKEKLSKNCGEAKESTSHLTFPLLKKRHVTLTGNELKPRVVIVGDVHGCFDELLKLLEKCGGNASDTTVILVGDLVNKGPYSAEVVAYARKNGFYSVRGNHDEALLKDIHRGGNKYDYAKHLSVEDIDYLEQMPYTIRLPDHKAIIVHAGLVPGVELEQQQFDDMTLMRNLISSQGPGGRTNYVSAEHGKNGQPCAAVWSGPEHVYFGHDAKRGLQQEKFATGLDTGACYGRRLSAMVLPDKLLVQVDAAHEYTPPKSKN